MAMSELLRNGSRALAEHQIGSPALDARLLLQHAAKLNHADFISAQNDPADDVVADLFNSMLQQRMAGEPVHRIIGIREFYGIEFQISPVVLDPRPETELLVSCIFEDYRDRRGLRFADLGTGSGAIAISLLLHLEESSCLAVDLCDEALSVAKKNAKVLSVADRLDLVCANFLHQAGEQFDFIVSNPPYIPSGEIASLQPEVRLHDPILALDGGADGLAAYRDIFSHVGERLKPEGKLYLECGRGQAPMIQLIAEENGWQWVRNHQDLSGATRLLVFGSPSVNADRADFANSARKSLES